MFGHVEFLHYFQPMSFKFIWLNVFIPNNSIQLFLKIFIFRDWLWNLHKTSVAVVFQSCSSSVAVVFQLCFSTVSVVSKVVSLCFSGVSVLFQWCCKCVKDIEQMFNPKNKKHCYQWKKFTIIGNFLWMCHMHSLCLALRNTFGIACNIDGHWSVITTTSSLPIASINASNNQT